MKSFKQRLKTILLLSTILPVIGFICLFFFKYLSINVEAEKALFKEDVLHFEKDVLNQVSNYDQLLQTSLDFLSNEVTVLDDTEKKSFLDGILRNDNIQSYIYLYDRELITDQVLNKRIKDEIRSFVRLSHDGFFISIIDDSIYFGAEKDDNLLVFQGSTEAFFEDIRFQLDESTDYDLVYKNFTIIEELDVEVDETIQLFYDSGFFIGVHHSGIVDTRMIKNISREIFFMLSQLLLVLAILIIYIIMMILLVNKMVSRLLKPLSDLTNKVNSLSKDMRTEEVTTEAGDLSEIVNLFNEMIVSAFSNIASVKQRSDDILEKNEIMVELNSQLEDSLDQIEQSTLELEIYEKQSKALVDSIKDLMWVVDAKGRIVYINNVIEDKLGYRVEDLIGIKLENILKQDYETQEIFQEMFYDDFESVDLIFENKSGENQEIFSASTKRIFLNDKLDKIQGVCRDITEERFIQSQMHQKNEISNTLNEISEILTKPEKLDSLLNHIVIRIDKLLDPLVCTIRLVDDKGRLELVAGIGEYYSQVQETYLNMDRDISGKAIKDGKIILINEFDKNYYDNYEEVYTIAEKSKEMIFLPLEYDHKIIGVMSISLRNKISEVNLKILKVFTNQASAAIEKARIYDELENNYMNIIKALASTVEAKDAYTEDHSVRVSKYSRMISEALGLSDEEINYMDIAGLLHDIGKVGVSDLTLTKEGKLTDNEFKEIKKHPVNGARIVSEMKLHPYIIEGVLLHHKRYDLKGYPDIIIDSLPLPARIIGVADAFDAMTSNRSYQKARSFDEALIELKKNKGTQFCPEVVDAVDSIIGKIKLTS